MGLVCLCVNLCPPWIRKAELSATEVNCRPERDIYLNQEEIRCKLLLHICLLVQRFVIQGSHSSQMEMSNVWF